MTITILEPSKEESEEYLKEREEKERVAKTVATPIQQQTVQKSLTKKRIRFPETSVTVKQLSIQNFRNYQEL